MSNYVELQTRGVITSTTAIFLLSPPPLITKLQTRGFITSTIAIFLLSPLSISGELHY